MKYNNSATSCGRRWPRRPTCRSTSSAGIRPGLPGNGQNAYAASRAATSTRPSATSPAGNQAFANDRAGNELLDVRRRVQLRQIIGFASKPRRLQRRRRQPRLRGRRLQRRDAAGHAVQPVGPRVRHDHALLERRSKPTSATSTARRRRRSRVSVRDGTCMLCDRCSQSQTGRAVLFTSYRRPRAPRRPLPASPGPRQGEPAVVDDQLRHHQPSEPRVFVQPLGQQRHVLVPSQQLAEHAVQHQPRARAEVGALRTAACRRAPASPPARRSAAGRTRGRPRS